MKYGKMSIKKGYMGEKKWRTDYMLPFSHRFAANIYHAISNYDIVCAVDTNSDLIENIQFDVGTVVKLIQETNDQGEVLFWAELMDDFIEYHLGRTYDFEKINWIKCIEL